MTVADQHQHDWQDFCEHLEVDAMKLSDLVERLEEARGEAQRLMESEGTDFKAAARVRDLIEQALEIARVV